MKAYLVDTNVLLRAIQRQDLTLRNLAREAIKTLHRRGDSLCICPQNLIELWSVATRPTNVNGLGMEIVGTKRTVGRCEAFFRLLPETPDIFLEWKRLVSAHHVSGLKVHDARLVATMNVHGISSIVTFDTEDFKRYRLRCSTPNKRAQRNGSPRERFDCLPLAVSGRACLGPSGMVTASSKPPVCFRPELLRR